LAKYAKTFRDGDEDFIDVVNRADCFGAQMRAFSKRRQRCGFEIWWDTKEGKAEERLR